MHGTRACIAIDLPGWTLFLSPEGRSEGACPQTTVPAGYQERCLTPLYGAASLQVRAHQVGRGPLQGPCTPLVSPGLGYLLTVRS